MGTNLGLISLSSPRGPFGEKHHSGDKRKVPCTAGTPHPQPAAELSHYRPVAFLGRWPIGFPGTKYLPALYRPINDEGNAILSDSRVSIDLILKTTL